MYSCEIDSVQSFHKRQVERFKKNSCLRIKKEREGLKLLSNRGRQYLTSLGNTLYLQKGLKL